MELADKGFATPIPSLADQTFTASQPEPNESEEETDPYYNPHDTANNPFNRFNSSSQAKQSI
jgi:hypothetical protein